MYKSIKKARPATTFKHNDKYSKSKNYQFYIQFCFKDKQIQLKLLRMCKNCKMPYGRHNGEKCPEEYKRAYKFIKSLKSIMSNSYEGRIDA
jgi:hypothetical protein